MVYLTQSTSYYVMLESQENIITGSYRYLTCYWKVTSLFSVPDKSVISNNIILCFIKQAMFIRALFCGGTEWVIAGKVFPVY